MQRQIYAAAGKEFQEEEQPTPQDRVEEHFTTEQESQETHEEHEEAVEEEEIAEEPEEPVE